MPNKLVDLNHIDVSYFVNTVKFLNFRINLKFKQRSQTLREFCQKDANGIANSEDPDQTAPLGAV